MSTLTKITTVESKLFLRDPTSAALALLLPVGLLVVFGSIGLGDTANEDTSDGISAAFLPAMVMALSVAMLSLATLPTVLATYREKGILRRMRTTPVHPSKVLTAQLVVYVGAAVLAAVLVLVVGALFFDGGWPSNPLAFALAFVLMTAALMSVGLLIAAVAKTAKMATGIGMALFFPSMFFAGVWTPGNLMPEWARPIRDVTPMGAGMEALQDAWAGDWPGSANLIALVAVAVGLSAIAARLFRWE